MKQLKMKKQGAAYLFQDHETCVYRGETTSGKQGSTMELKNAYGDTLVQITYPKVAGFHFLRGRKPLSIHVIMDGQETLLEVQDARYQVSLQNVLYTFICGNLDGDSCAIMMCEEEVLGGKREAEICLKDSLYSAIFCAFISFIYEYKEKVILNEDSFRNLWGKLA